MSEECLNDCVAPDLFPKRPNNRPALPCINYRIGAYADFRDHLLRHLNLNPVLQAWTHRAPDDPGIALLETASVLGDILTFYQDLYANEAFLRTAQWRNSVAQLVRLLGYRLKPGLGGQGRFAFEVKGTGTVTVPAGFPLKAQLDGAADTADFQTLDDLTAFPYLSRFNLYRPRKYKSYLGAGAYRFELASVDGATDAPGLAAAGLKKGDYLFLTPDESIWSVNGTAFSTQQAHQIVTVSSVTITLGRVIVEIDGHLADSWSTPVTAYRIGRTFHHFGYNAPVKTVTNQTDNTGKITASAQSDTEFRRHLAFDCGDSGANIELAPDFLPLDQEVDDLSVGAKLIITGRTDRNDYELTGTIDRFTIVRTIKSLRSGPIQWGNLNGNPTFVTIYPEFFPTNADDAATDIRAIRVHEVLGPALTLRHRAMFRNKKFNDSHKTLAFYGTQAQALASVSRPLLLQRDSDGKIVELTCTSAASDFDPGATRDTVNPWMWDLAFDKLPTPFKHKHFDETTPAVTVFGNLVDADQGKMEKTAVLGNGDARQTFQTFKLPKSPLTFHSSAIATPPEVPSLTVYVNNREWTRVDSFFGRGPLEEIYIVRMDSSGTSYVQFGDGETGARLPSGLQNVTALYRTGNGAHGPLKSGAKVQAGARLDNLNQVDLPGVISGGADPEPAGQARTAAPGKIQSLGRLVSLADYESEVLNIGGVTRAAAAWDDYDGVPSVVLTVLMAAGQANEFSDVRAKIAEYQRSRGPNRFPVIVNQGKLRYIYLDVQYAFDPRLQRDDVELALRTVLGLAPDNAAAPRGLFALSDREFGEPEYATRIEGALQNVSGIRWCKVTALGLLDSGDDPSKLVSPADPKPLAEILTCADTEILQLDVTHLTPTSAAPAAADPCAST
jgi:hypothetical protein